MAGTGDGLGKGRNAEEEAFRVHAPSGHMVKSRMTVIRVDGELPKNVDLTLESYVYGRADIYLSPFCYLIGNPISYKAVKEGGIPPLYWTGKFL